MQKINFNDLPDTNTPINSSNLNQLQTNVENAINGIVESGSNDNGSYIKYADGTMIQRGNVLAPADVGYADLTYPLPFYGAKDDITLTSNHVYVGGTTYGGTAQILNITVVQKVDLTSGYIYSYLTSGSIASYPRNINWVAIGRWK